MGSKTAVENRFRDNVRHERKRRGWSCAEVSEELRNRGLPHIVPSTISKIESGDRAVRIDEAAGFADLFGTSTDTLLGRPSGGADLMWALSKLSSNAHKMVNEISSLQQRLRADAQDVSDYGVRGREAQIAPTLGAVGVVQRELEVAKQAIIRLAGEFPLPGRG
jgi:transcriptional regulator with XRE-family HTH domain